jgi:hypothetical protein
MHDTTSKSNNAQEHVDVDFTEGWNKREANQRTTPVEAESRWETSLESNEQLTSDVDQQHANASARHQGLAALTSEIALYIASWQCGVFFLDLQKPHTKKYRTQIEPAVILHVACPLFFIFTYHSPTTAAWISQSRSRKPRE